MSARRWSFRTAGERTRSISRPGSARLANGGEILATREVTHLAQAIDGVLYSPRSPRPVKGVAEPVRPVRVSAVGQDTVRGFAELGFARAQAPPAHRPARRRAIQVAAAAAVLIVVAAIATGLGAGGSSSIRLAANEVGAIATNSGQVALALPVSAQPTDIAVGNDGAIWVVSSAQGTLSRIDLKNHAITQIRVGTDPAAVAVAPDGSVWVANSGDGTVSRVSPDNDAVVATIRVGAGPSALVAGANAVWVANTLTASVTKIDLADDSVLATIPVGSEPAGIAIGGGSVWVADQGDGTVHRLDQQSGAQVVAPIPVGRGPISVAFGDGAAWVVNSIDGTMSRIDAQSNSVTTIPVGQGPFDVAVGAGDVWVSNEYGNEVAEVDPVKLTVTQTTKINSAPLGLTLAGDRLWVATDGIGAVAHRGGVLYAMATGISAGQGDPPTIDPGSAYTYGLWKILILTSDGLVAYRHEGGVAGAALVPDLAASLPTPTDNGLTYTFRLRSGIRYSNGAHVRASDFARGLERAFRVGGGPVAYFSSLVGGQQCLQSPRSCDLSRGVVADDATGTVVFHLTNPTPTCSTSSRCRLPIPYHLGPRWHSRRARSPARDRTRSRPTRLPPRPVRTAGCSSSAIDTSASGRPPPSPAASRIRSWSRPVTALRPNWRRLSRVEPTMPGTARRKARSPRSASASHPSCTKASGPQPGSCG